MGNKRDSFEKLGVLAKSDGIDKMSTALFTGLIGIVLLCALLPVFISQIAGLGANTVLASWSGLTGFQTIAYIIPTVFIIGLIILLVRFFSGSRE